jgi:hypothetical protein
MAKNSATAEIDSGGGGEEAFAAVFVLRLPKKNRLLSSENSALITGVEQIQITKGSLWRRST